MTLIFHGLYGLKECKGNCEGCGCYGFPTMALMEVSLPSTLRLVMFGDGIDFDLPKFLGWKHVNRCYPWCHGCVVGWSDFPQRRDVIRSPGSYPFSNAVQGWGGNELPPGRTQDVFQLKWRFFKGNDLGSKRIDMMWPHFSVDLMQSLFSASIKDLWFCILRSSLTWPPSQQS